MNPSKITRRPWIVPAAVLILTAAVYASCLSFEFVHDDHAQIVGTRQFKSWRYAPSYFTRGVWAWQSPTAFVPYYRPAFQLWMLVNYKLFGEDPLWWHLTSVLMHLAVTLLVYLLALRWTKDQFTAGLAAALFGLHPAHLESVAWPSGITDPLAAFFVLLSLLCYLRAWRAAALACYGVAILAKEVALVLPVLVFVYEWFHSEKETRLRRALTGCAIFLPVAVLYFAARFAAIGWHRIGATPMPLASLILTLPSILSFYLKHLIWPVNLSYFYMTPGPAIMPAALLAAAAAAVWLLARRSAWIAIGALWTVAALVPVFEIRVFNPNDALHDRYLYLPSVGFCLMLSVVLRRLPMPVATTVPILAALAYGTVSQARYWENNQALFERAVTLTPRHAIANQCMGTVMFLRKRYSVAADYYRRAIEIQPNMADAIYGVGRSYYALGMAAESERYFLRYIAQRPRDPRPYLYYGLALMKRGELDDAERLIRFALKVRGPDEYANYHAALAEVLRKKGDPEGARREDEAESRENPGASANP
ncbi:MAG: tetratricopeptide repeat protein [Bryobacteraceae bacterium]